MSTPEKISCAFLEKKITENQRVLYLFYAVYDFKKLPMEYRSDTGWDGTLTVQEVKEIAQSKEKMCKLSAFVQSELRRGFDFAVSCP